MTHRFEFDSICYGHIGDMAPSKRKRSSSVVLATSPAQRHSESPRKRRKKRKKKYETETLPAFVTDPESTDTPIIIRGSSLERPTEEEEKKKEKKKKGKKKKKHLDVDTEPELIVVNELQGESSNHVDEGRKKKKKKKEKRREELEPSAEQVLSDEGRDRELFTHYVANLMRLHRKHYNSNPTRKGRDGYTDPIVSP